MKKSGIETKRSQNHLEEKSYEGLISCCEKAGSTSMGEGEIDSKEKSSGHVGLEGSHEEK